MFVPKWAIDQK